MAGAALALRDVHLPPAPAWWPPAPGWWVLAAGVCIALLAAYAWQSRRTRRRRAIEAVFDNAVDAAPGKAAQVAAISELLRRAARLHEPAADRLQGDAWLALLDGDDAARPFSDGPGRLVLDGGFRPAVEAGELAALRAAARRRFLQWMQAR